MVLHHEFRGHRLAGLLFKALSGLIPLKLEVLRADRSLAGFNHDIGLMTLEDVAYAEHAEADHKQSDQNAGEGRFGEGAE